MDRSQASREPVREPLDPIQERLACSQGLLGPVQGALGPLQAPLEDLQTRKERSQARKERLETSPTKLPPTSQPHLAAGTLTHARNEGLGTPGATMRYKVYVVLTTGNERGSHAVAVTRQ